MLGGPNRDKWAKKKNPKFSFDVDFYKYFTDSSHNAKKKTDIFERQIHNQILL